MKTAIRKSSNGGDLLNRLEQMYPVSETDLNVHTEIASLSEFPTAARISEFLAQLDQLMGRMNAPFYGPTEPHLRLAGKICPKSWESCKEMSERKSRTHFYDDLDNLLI